MFISIHNIIINSEFQFLDLTICAQVRDFTAYDRNTYAVNHQTRRQPVIHLRSATYVKYLRLSDRKSDFQTVAVPSQTVNILPDRENDF